MIVLSIGVFLLILSLCGGSIRIYGFYIALALVGAIFAFNSQNQDYETYQSPFNNPEDFAEIGYIYLVHGLKFLGGSSHRTVQLFLALIIISYFMYLRRFIAYPFLLVVLYFLFPGPIDVIQIRNTIATFLFLLSILFYLDKRFVISIIFILGSLSFHMFGLIYAVIYITALIKNNLYRNIVIFVGFITFSCGLLFIIPILSSSGYFRTLSFYVADSFKLSSIIFWGGGIIIDLIVFKIFINKSDPAYNNDFTKILYAVISASFMFITSLGFLYDINRLYRAIFIIKITLGTYLFYNSKSKIRYLIFIYMAVSTISLFIYYDSGLDLDWVYFGN